MVIHELSIDGIKHSIYIKTSIKKAYKDLCIALLGDLSDADQSRITNIDKNKRRIIYFTDVVRCFEPVGNTSRPESISCICGKQHIKDLYLIINKATLDEHIIGSTCAKNWFREEKVINGCMYCNRINKNGGDCINCSGKTNIKSMFLMWKNEVIEKKEMVSFGKYKHLTYRQLCGSTDIRIKGYIDWCLNLSQMKESIKERLRYFSDKQSRLMYCNNDGQL